MKKMRIQLIGCFYQLEFYLKEKKYLIILNSFVQIDFFMHIKKLSESKHTHRQLCAARLLVIQLRIDEIYLHNLLQFVFHLLPDDAFIHWIHFCTNRTTEIIGKCIRWHITNWTVNTEFIR